MGNICLKVETLWFMVAEMCLSGVNVDKFVYFIGLSTQIVTCICHLFFEVFHLFTANQRMVNKRQTTDSMAVY